MHNEPAFNHLIESPQSISRTRDWFALDALLHAEVHVVALTGPTAAALCHLLCFVGVADGRGPAILVLGKHLVDLRPGDPTHSLLKPLLRSLFAHSPSPFA